MFTLKMVSLSIVKSLLGRKCGLKKIIYSLVFLCVVWVICVRYCVPKLRPQFSSLEADYCESHVEASDLEVRGKKYVLVRPKSIDVDVYEEANSLIEILEAFPQYDGATCFGSNEDKGNYPQKASESCWFETKNWTMLINGVKRKEYTRSEESQKHHWFWICNIVEVPFVIRQNVYERIRLNKSYCEASLLDFFVRSNGTLKIAASPKCSFAKSETVPRIPKPKRQILLDYGLLGYHYNLLRIVRPHSITWTKCSYQNSSCPDIPEQQDRLENVLLPYCCKTMVNQILIQTADALKRIGIDYRVCFSTLLGAIRSRTAIPWDGDVDICLNSDDMNTVTFQKLNDALKPSNFSYAYLFGVHRVIPLNPFVKHISNQSLVSELFSEHVLQHMKEMLPIPAPVWKLYTYADFYVYNKIFQRKKIDITIDGLKYPTGERPHDLLREWYGDKYMSTDENDRMNSGSVSGLSLFEKIHRLFHLLY